MNALLEADGSTQAVKWNGGEGSFVASGTFGGGSLSLEFSNDDKATWIALGGDATITEGGGSGFILPLGVWVRATLTGATDPSINVSF